MTINVTPDEAFEPPRNEITVSVTTGHVMTDVAVYRNDSTGRSLIRTQPSAGFDSRTVYDYEAPYGESVTYDWVGSAFDPSLNATTFTENWTAYPGPWSSTSGSGSVASNRVTYVDGSGGVLGSSLSQTVTFAWDQITIAYMQKTGATNFGFIRFRAATSGLPILQVGVSSSLVQITTYSGGVASSTSTTISSLQPFTITRVTGGYTITGTGGSATVAGDYDDVDRVSITAYNAGSTVVGAITAETLATPTSYAEESSPVVLDSDRAWLIHPSTVALSFPLAQTDSTVAGIAGVDEIVNRSATTLHPIMGSAHPIAVTTGIRNGDETALIVTTVTSDERVAMRALLASDFPILVQIPAAWDLGFASGFYAVGDAREARGPAVGSDPWRQFRLPLTRVQPPIADVEETSWTWAHVVLEFPTWASVKAAFATWADLATNTRI